MKTSSIKKLYELHAWVGVITGILLFVIALTGALSVFGKPELMMWAKPEAQIQPLLDYKKLDQIIEKYAAEVPESYWETVDVIPPNVFSEQKLILRFEDRHTGQENPGPAMAIQYVLDPVTFALIEKEQLPIEDLFKDHEMDMAHFLVDFHADLHLGRPVGLLLTGILGLTLMASIVTGIFIHRKILKQLFTFRRHKNASLALNDGHKMMGIWGLLFHSVIAFTGAFLGLALVILVPAAAFVSFEGDQEKLIEAFSTQPNIERSVPAPTNVADMILKSENFNAEAELFSVTVKGYGDANARGYAFILGGEQVTTLQLKFDHQGELLESYGTYGKLEGVSGEILDLMFPLHFGNFGGIFTKVVWAILGLSTALLPLTGMMLWIERGLTQANPRFSRQTYLNLNKLNLGACGGIVLACALLFPLQLVLNAGFAVDLHTPAIFGGFFASWVLVIIWALLDNNSRRVTQNLFHLIAALLISVLPLHLILQGQFVWQVIQAGNYVPIAVSTVSLVIGLSICYCQYKWPQRLRLSVEVSEASDPLITGSKELKHG